MRRYLEQHGILAGGIFLVAAVVGIVSGVSAVWRGGSVPVPTPEPTAPGTALAGGCMLQDVAAPVRRTIPAAETSHPFDGAYHMRSFSVLDGGATLGPFDAEGTGRGPDAALQAAASLERNVRAILADNAPHCLDPE